MSAHTCIRMCMNSLVVTKNKDWTETGDAMESFEEKIGDDLCSRYQSALVLSMKFESLGAHARTPILC